MMDIIFVSVLIIFLTFFLSFIQGKRFLNIKIGTKSFLNKDAWKKIFLHAFIITFLFIAILYASQTFSGNIKFFDLNDLEKIFAVIIVSFFFFSFFHLGFHIFKNENKKGKKANGLAVVIVSLIFGYFLIMLLFSQIYEATQFLVIPLLIIWFLSFIGVPILYANYKK